MPPLYSSIASHKIYYVKFKLSVMGLRPVKDDSFIYVTVGLRPARWRWLALWFPNGSPSDQIRSLLDRAMKFWPGGPLVFRGGAR